MAQFFNNETIIAPQAVVAIDDSLIGPTGTSSTVVNVGVVGTSTKGQPDFPYLVSSLDQATALFGQGPLVDGMARAFSPASGGGAQSVIGIRVDKATESALNLLDSNSAVAIKLTTRDYGVYTRSLYAKVEAATNPGSNNVPVGALKVTVGSGTTKVVGDNLGYNCLDVAYTQTGGQVSVAKWSGTVQTAYPDVAGTSGAGEVLSVVVDTAGTGYGTHVPTVTFSAPQTPGGVTATGTAVLDITGDYVASVTITEDGSGYTAPPTVTFGAVSPVATTLATAHTTVGTPKTSIVVTTSVSGQDTHQLVGQQIVIHGGSDDVADFVTTVSSESGGTLTVSPGDPFVRTTSTTVTGTAVAILLKGASSGDTAGYALSNYGTLTDLALAVAGTGNNGHWIAQAPVAVNPAPLSNATVGAGASPQVLDVGQVASITQTTNTGSPNWADVTGIAQAIVDWMNGRGEPYFTAERLSTGAPSGAVPVAVAATFASGGDDDGHGGSLLANNLILSNQDWQDALTALGTVDAPLFVLMTGNTAIIALGDAHAVTMSTTGRLERIQIAGLALGKSTQDALNEANSLNSFRTCLVYPGIQDFDSSGSLVTLAPFYAAAQVAGLAASTGENIALTGRTLRIQGLETRSALNGGSFGNADVDACLQGGVMPLVFRPGRGFVIAQSITTWLQDPKFSKRELSVRRVCDRLARSIRERLDDLIGEGVSSGFLNDVLNNTQAILEQYVQLGYIVGDDTNPAYLGLSASVQQGNPDTVLVSFQASPAIPANYILVTAHLSAFGN